MSVRPRTLIVGIGSPHGDDQIGWLVARAIGERLGDTVDLRCLSAPVDLLSFLGNQDRLCILDACRGTGPVGSCKMWRWPDLPVEGTRIEGTHGISLRDALELASALGKLPRETVIWSIEGASFQPGDPMSHELNCAMETIVEHVLAQLTIAR